MKKIKYLLILSLIAVVAVGVLTGCQSAYKIDREHTYKITYCANGGSLAGKSERYINLYHSVEEDGQWHEVEPLLAPYPGEGNVLAAPTREGYKFIGWAKGKADADGNPVLLEGNAPLYYTDGGVYMSLVDEGAVSKSDAYVTEKDEKGNETEVLRDGFELRYYDFDREDFWQFKIDQVKSDIVLVAVWENYNQFILVDENDDQEKLDTITKPDFSFEDELYKAYETDKDWDGEDRWHDIFTKNGTVINLSNLIDAYNGYKKKEGYTPIRFYLDKEHEQEITFPYTVTDKVTLVYFSEIEGDYEVIRESSTSTAFANAVEDNKNIYLDADLKLDGRRFNAYNSTYSGIIRGNNHTIKGLRSEVSQSGAVRGKQNIYGGFFGDLENAEIYDLNLEYSFTFNISIDPDGKNALPMDRLCDVGAFARSMKGCLLSNVNVSATYEITRSEIEKDSYIDPETGRMKFERGPNEYDVTVNVGQQWAAQVDPTTVIESTCRINVTLKADESEQEESKDPSGGDNQEGDDNQETVPGGDDQEGDDNQETVPGGDDQEGDDNQETVPGGDDQEGDDNQETVPGGDDLDE